MDSILSVSMAFPGGDAEHLPWGVGGNEGAEGGGRGALLSPLPQRPAGETQGVSTRHAPSRLTCIKGYDTRSCPPVAVMEFTVDLSWDPHALL